MNDHPIIFVSSLLTFVMFICMIVWMAYEVGNNSC
jgi:hypothetical protein